MQSLKDKAVNGLLWSSLDAVGLNITRIVITIVIARLLPPADFGLIALINIFIALSATLVNGGFTTSLIRKTNVTIKDYSTVFTLNLLISLFLYVVLFFISPIISNFFDEPELNLITKVVSLVIVFNSFGIVQNISFRRALNFKVLAIVNIVSTIISGCTGIFMAYVGLGVWSLVAQITLKAFISSLLLWTVGNLKPKLGFNIESLKENFNFGYKVLLSDVINIISSNAYNLVIGKIYSTGSLGYYYQAKKLSAFASQIISNVFKNVSFPLLSSIQDDENRLNNIYLRFLRLIAYISFPLMMLLIIIAKPLFVLLLTEKWLESVQYFQLFCISGMLLPLIVLSGYMPLIKGRSDIFLKMEIFFKLQLILALIITFSVSIKAMIVGMVIQVSLQFFINIWLVSRLFKLSFLYQLRKLYDILLISLVVSVLTYCMAYIIHADSYLMFIQIVIFLTLYLGIGYLMKSKELREIKSIFILAPIKGKHI